MKPTTLFLLLIFSFTANTQALFGVLASRSANVQNASVFYHSTWQTKALTGTDPKMSGSDDAVGILTKGSGSNSNCYVFNNGNWLNKAILGEPITVTSAKGVVGFLTTKAGLIYNNGQWSQTQSILTADGAARAMALKDDYIFLVTNTACYTYNSQRFSKNKTLKHQELH